MDEQNAKSIARALHGETWQSGGGIWLVLFHRSDGKVLAMSDEVIKVYDSGLAFEEDRASSEIVMH